MTKRKPKPKGSSNPAQTDHLANIVRSDMRPLPMRITRLQFERLSARRAQDGLALQEHVRRAIDFYLGALERTVLPFTHPRPEPESPPAEPPVEVAAQSVRKPSARLRSK